MLEFNIGPSFLHMIFYNNFTGRSFSYLFDYSNCVCSNIFKDKAKELKSKESSLITDKCYVVKVNIFKEKCGCDKCLSECFLFYSCQPVYLANELVQVLKSEHCSNWNRCWIEMLLEQMFIFFSCIKNGVIYERLLEYACNCANMLVMKFSNTNLLEYKYSYKYFIEKLIANFQVVSKYSNNNNNERAIYCGREIGKVYFDIVENFAIMTFETEKEMNAYTKYEMQINKTRPQYLINSFRKCINSGDDFVELKRKDESKVKESRNNDEHSSILLCTSNDGTTTDRQSVDDESMENQYRESGNTLINNVSCLQTTVSHRNFSKNENSFNSSDNDEIVSYRNVEWNRIPVIHGCNRGDNNIVQCTCKSFSLGMILNLANGRALPKQTIENLKLLENNEATVTCRLATIAASALMNDGQSTVRRIIVPVVLSDIVNLAKQMQWPRVCNGIDKDAERLINDLLDQICFSEADRQSQLLNDSSNLKETSENKAVNTADIESSDQELKKNSISRLSERSKREIKMSSRFINSVFFDEASLPLATSVFQGSRSLGIQRRMEFVCDERRKRRVKSIGDECMKGMMELRDELSAKRTKLEFTNDLCNKKHKIEMIIDAWKKRGSSTVLRKLYFSVGNIDENKTIADLFIWCAYHHKYNCPCMLSVCKMKHNLLIWEPPKILKYVTHKVMSKVDINIRHGKESIQAYFFDSEEYCARTYGAPVNYSVRNNTELFSAKRLYELENNVTSSTNSFIKFKYLAFNKSVDNECGSADIIIEDSSDDVIKYECKENVNIVAEDQEQDIHIDIGDSGSSLVDIIVISDNEEETLQSSLDQDRYWRQGTIQLWRNDKSSTPRTYLKSKRKLNDNSKSKPSSDLQTDGNNLDGISTAEQNMDAKIIESDLQRYKSDIEVNSKQLKSAHLFQENFIDITNYDSTLENGLFRLKDHPLKDNIYCDNKLPKLALYCVTPGIGYLPIVEYSSKALVVFDPIFPEVLHSFKNLTAANIWLNKFLKDFLVFESIDISLKWIIVKPGIIKMKQSQPFSPAIFENSPIIITKHGEIRFSSKKEIVGEYKRKLVGDTVVDINGSDGKRKKIHLDCLKPIAAKIVTRTVNLVQQYPSKKTNKLPATTTTQIFNQNKFNSDTNNIKRYQLIPANLLIQMNVAPTLLNLNNNNSNYEYISSSVTNATSSDGRSPNILSNNFNENATEM